MKEYEYMADVGSIKLIHKSGAKLYISNNYGDGTFSFYIIDSNAELIQKFPNAKDTGIRLEDFGWKVMSYDCVKNYDSEGEELICNYTAIYRSGTSFIFLAY